MMSVLKVVIIGAIWIGLFHSLRAEEPADVGNGAYRYPNLQVAIQSWIPGDAIQSYRSHSSGSCSHGGTVGLGVGGKGGFGANVRCLTKQNRIASEFSIEPYESNKSLKPSTTEVDLSDLQSDLIEVTKDDDGRVYFLSLRPELVEVKLPATFSVDKLAPFDWDFANSPVVLDDEFYVGRIGMSGGSMAGISIVGVTNIEFSLRPLKSAEPIGMLQNGMLTIKLENNTIDISGVRNGADKVTLEGPFKVWVKILDDGGNIQEVQDAFRQQLELLEKRRADGDASITDDVLARIEHFIKEGRPMLLGSNARDVRKDELMEGLD